jgi:hypothetical protein
LIARHSAFGAESKDLGGAYFTHAVGSFSTTESHRAGAYICILGSHTGPLYIGATGNLYLRVMEHATYGCKRPLYFEG